MKGLITAGGRGTRMRPLTFSTNKHFIPLANRPLLFYAIEEMVKAGIKDIGINYNPGQLEEIRAVLGGGERWGVKFTYILQRRPLGLAHIIKVSRKFLGKERFVMHLGDNIFFPGIKSLVDEFRKNKKINALLVIIHHPENRRMGVPYFDKKGNLREVVEKPESPPHDWAVPGLYFFDHHALECFEGKGAISPSARGELEIVSVYNWLLNHGYKVAVKEFKGTWKDPGKFADWLTANQFLLDKLLEPKILSPVEETVQIEGRVRIGRQCQIENSLIRGPVIIGNRVRVKNSFIGPYSSIGDDCEIINAKIENSVLMEGVVVKNIPKPLDSCLIGKESVVEGNHHSLKTIGLFVGNQCVLKL